MNRDNYSKKALNLSTMVGKNLEICVSQMAENILKLSTMVGEKFEIYTSQRINVTISQTNHVHELSRTKSN